jgi:hypothetical protein
VTTWKGIGKHYCLALGHHFVLGVKLFEQSCRVYRKIECTLTTTLSFALVLPNVTCYDNFYVNLSQRLVCYIDIVLICL